MPAIWALGLEAAPVKYEAGEEWTALVWTVPAVVPLVWVRAVPVEALKPSVMVTFWAAAHDFGSWPWNCASATSGGRRAAYVGAAGALDEAEGAGGTRPRGPAARLAEAGVVAETVDGVGSVAAWTASVLGRPSSSKLTGHVASAKGIGAGGALGGGGGGRELLSLDEDFVNEAFVDHGSETGRAEEEQGEGGWQAHFGGRMARKASEHFWVVGSVASGGQQMCNERLKTEVSD
jgi:hypothetical protein